MLRPRYRARLTGSPVAERKCRLRSSDRRARTSASATSPESTPELAAGFTGAGGGADVVRVAGADEDDVEAVEREGLLVADQTLGHATIVAQTAVRVGWARLGESAGAQVPRAGSFDRLRAGSGASGLVRKIRLGPTAFGTGLIFICPTSSECFHMTPSCLLSGASLTFVPTDFVRSGGFIEHRRRLGHTPSVHLYERQQGAGGGLRGCVS